MIDWKLKRKLESEAFYNLMLTYRNAPILDWDAVVRSFEAVKGFLLDPFSGLSPDKIRAVLSPLIIDECDLPKSHRWKPAPAPKGRKK